MHKIGGTAGECRSHGVADHFCAAGVEYQGDGNAGEKHTDAGAARHAGGCFCRPFQQAQAHHDYQGKQQGQVVQHGIGERIGDQTADENGNGTGCAEVGGDGDRQRRGHGSHVCTGKEQSGEKTAAGLPENAWNGDAMEELRLAGVVHDGNVLSLRSVCRRTFLHVFCLRIFRDSSRKSVVAVCVHSDTPAGSEARCLKYHWCIHYTVWREKYLSESLASF